MDRWKGSDCRAFDCDRYASRDIDVMPICPNHAWQVAQHFMEALTEQARIDAEKAMEQAHEARERTHGNREDPVVYYARIGDYIKIGYTTRLKNRLRTLRVDELLAIEPGHADLERHRHQQFAAERIDLRRENFTPSQALYTHIAGLRAIHDLPHWAAVPRASKITTRRKETA